MSESTKTTPEAGTTTTTAPDKAVETERAHAQHFKGLYEETNKTVSALQQELNSLKADKDKWMRERAEKGGDKERQDFEQHVTKEVEGRFSKKLTEAEKRAQELESKVKRFEVITPAIQEAAKIFNEDALELIQGKIELHLDSDSEGIFVKGADGKPIPSEEDPRSKRMGLSEFLNSLAKKYPSVVKSQAVAGGKQPGTKGSFVNGSEIKSMKDLERMSPDEIRKLPPEVLRRVLA